ncbi:DNA internalization-related competence protein ComEC/Rec2 [Pseudomonas sp. DC3000-4b1]|uniref:DNA internalization-related competence protein ComEC/Rec2 n=1 Tax=unclassified Pseudomonas TaxID=196821 RepID=UPI003CF60C75
MVRALLALACGILAARAWPGPPSSWVASLLASAALALLALAWRPALWLGLGLAGLAWALAAALQVQADQLATSLENRTLWLEGRVAGLPSRAGGVTHFELVQARSRRAALPSRVRLRWHGAPTLREGERWRLAATLARPRGQVNPGGLDYEAWLFARGIGATGSVKDGQRLETRASSLRERLRQRLLEAQAHPLLLPLVLGDGSGLTERHWRVLQSTGTVHLFVVSGQHVGLAAGLAYGLIAGLWRLGLWPRRWPWLPWACGCALLSALGYGHMAGFAVPVQRACLMIAVVLLWRLRLRQPGVFTPLLLALVAVLVASPLVMLMPGFWLSFTAVGVLLFGFAGRLGPWPWWRAWARAQWLVALGLAPVLALLALPISLSGPWVNLFAGPWISFVVLPLALLGSVALVLSPWGGEALLGLAGRGLEALLKVVAPVADLAPAWLGPGLPLWSAVLALLGALLLLLPMGLPLRVLGLPLLLQLGFPSLARPPWGQAQVMQLDVGQGLAVLVRTRDHVLLFDAGPRYSSNDAGERIVVPSLRRLGISRLDTLIISHDHADHSGGAQAVLKSLKPARVLAGEPLAAPDAWRAQPCENAAGWEWNGVRFQTWRWSAAQDSNPSSCVLLVEAEGERLLLTGDIDARAERALVSAWPGLQARWLQAPHHGSRTSSSALLLDSLQPEAALISRGWNSRFGHPHPEVVRRLDERGIARWDSALHGAVELRLGASQPAQGWRQRARLWRAMAADEAQ